MSNEELLTILNQTRITVNEQRERIAALEDDNTTLAQKLIDLENRLDQLQKLILKAEETGPNNQREFRGWEIWPVLRKWASGEIE